MPTLSVQVLNIELDITSGLNICWTACHNCCVIAVHFGRFGTAHELGQLANGSRRPPVQTVPVQTTVRPVSGQRAARYTAAAGPATVVCATCQLWGGRARASIPLHGPSEYPCTSGHGLFSCWPVGPATLHRHMGITFIATPPSRSLLLGLARLESAPEARRQVWCLLSPFSRDGSRLSHAACRD